MRDWIVILIIALLSAAIGFWALRRNTSTQGSDTTGAEASSAASTPQVSAPSNAHPVQSTTKPATTKPLAVLMFDGAPGRVAVVRSEVVIGRHSEDDIRISDVRVSRHHAKLVAKSGGSFEIHNLTAVRSEPNPMLINGEAREHADIADGDVVSLGGVNFTFRLAA